MANPPQFSAPGVYVQEVPTGARTIVAGSTAVAAFLGRAATGPINLSETVHSWRAFDQTFGSLDRDLPLGFAVRDFFMNGGSAAVIVRLDEAKTGLERWTAGLAALDRADSVNLLVTPPDQYGVDLPVEVNQAAAAYAVKRAAMLLLDAPGAWSEVVEKGVLTAIQPASLGMSGEQARNAAVYFPRIRKIDPTSGRVEVFPVAGSIAGVFARTDMSRGVWAAPAGLSATLSDVEGVELPISDAVNRALNAQGINCLRTFPDVGTVIWGTRTLAGAEGVGDDFMYVPARRLALHILDSVEKGTRWAVFEPNDEPLWAELRASIDGFMAELLRRGAFAAGSAQDAYSVRCDRTTTTQADIDQGIVNYTIGFAPVRPAEFVLLSGQIRAGEAP